jgi:organic radical activating enzyme
MKSACPTAATPSRADWTDPQGRLLSYLRLAVTDRCNLRCRYCMKSSGVASRPPVTQLDFDDLTRVCRLMARGGVRKIRVTVGDPLVRRGVVDWMRAALDRLTRTVNPVEAEGSHMLTGPARANSLVEFAADRRPGSTPPAWIL